MLPNVKYEGTKELNKALFFLTSNPECKVIAGGTDIIVEMRKSDKPHTLIDITPIRELDYIEEAKDKISIGAITTHAKISSDPIIRKFAKPLSMACSTVGAPGIRNLATIGGNICNASPAADSLAPLTLLDATLTLTSIDRERRIPLTEFIKGAYKTDIHPGELLTQIEFNPLPENSFSYFIKLGRRNALAISRLSVATSITITGESITEARISPGAVFRSPQRVKVAEDFLIGKKSSYELFEEAGKLVSKEMIAQTGVRWSTPYKQPVLASLVKRCLVQSLGWKVER